ncbi:MAG: GNAT family N-acetyltransferase [Acidimicrobiia bacterium]
MRSIVRAGRVTEGVYRVATPSKAELTVEAGAYERPGRSAGPAPMELMLASLVTCAGSTIESVLAKMRQPVTGLNVVAEGVRSESVPRVYTSILLEFQVASAAPEDRLHRAIEVTERTCSASVMLSRVVDMSHRLVVVREVEAERTRPLRQQVLRPHQSLDELAAEEDPAATWLAALTDDAVVGTVSVAPEASPDEATAAPFRLRAMTTATEFRGRGLGAVLLEAALASARAGGADSVWCSARAPVVDFYLRAGFSATSQPYEVPHIGPHVRMSRPL